MTMSFRRAGVGLLAAVALALPVAGFAAPSADAASYRYKNCAALQKVYKHGVGKSSARDKVRGSTKPVITFKKSTKIYNAVIKQNKRLDADKDGVACEKR